MGNTKRRTEMRIPWNMNKKKDELRAGCEEKGWPWIDFSVWKENPVQFLSIFRDCLVGLHAMFGEREKKVHPSKTFPFFFYFLPLLFLCIICWLWRWWWNDKPKREREWIRFYYIVGYLFSVEQFPFFSSSPSTVKK